jgi:DNA-binding response OmpR family regulator
MVGDRERALEAGFDGYLTKPIDFATFADRVEGLLP